jgi:hypothetical protein
MQMKLRYFLLPLLGLSQTLWAGPAQVLVAVKIESVKFRKGLDVALPATEAAIAQKLATQLKDMFPPFEWTTTMPADGAAATLTATLAQDADALPNIVLRWSAKVGDTDLSLHRVREWPMYESSNPDRPYRDPARLASDVDAKIKRWLNTDNAESDIHDDFIKWVPLATQVEFVENETAVLIPLAWGSAKISDESEFRLEFTRPEPLSKMKVLLNGVAERMSGTMQGKTQSIVASCVASGRPVPSDIWNTCVAILEQQNPPPLFVSFERYKFAGLASGILPSGTSGAP